METLIFAGGNANDVTFALEHSRGGEAIDSRAEGQRHTGARCAKIDAGQLAQAEEQFFFECCVASYALDAFYRAT